MKLSDLEKQWIIQKRFDFYDKNEKVIEGAYIILREPTEDEISNAPDDAKKQNKYLLNNVIPACLIEHSFEDEEGNPANKNEVMSLIKKSGGKTFKILKEWMNDCMGIEIKEEEEKKKE